MERRWQKYVERTVPIKNWPFTPLEESENEAALVIAGQIKAEVEKLFSQAEKAGVIREEFGEFERKLEDKRIAFLGPHFISMRPLFKDADFLVEIRHDEEDGSAEIEESYTFFPDMVIKRPNAWHAEWVTNPDGTKTVQIDHDTDPEGKPNYQVEASELKELLTKIKRSTLGDLHF